MADIARIIAGGFLMSAAALVGGVTTLRKPATLDRMISPLIATAGGTLFGGALFHMLPEDMKTMDPLAPSGWLERQGNTRANFDKKATGATLWCRICERLHKRRQYGR